MLLYFLRVRPSPGVPPSSPGIMHAHARSHTHIHTPVPLTCRTLPWGLSGNSSTWLYNGSSDLRATLVFFLAMQTPFSSR